MTSLRPNRFRSATHLAMDLQQAVRTTIHSQTIRTHLHAAELCARQPIIAVPLNRRHLAARL